MVDEVNIKISGEGKTAKVVTVKKKPTKKKTIHKKTTKKKAAKKRTTTRRAAPKQNRQTEKILIENFVAMQKVMTGMAEKFDGLSKQISKLLKLFEDSAETLVEKDINLEITEGKDQGELLEKLNKILEQNKIIAKGLTLMHETAVNPTTHYSLAPHPEILKAASLPKPPMPMPTAPIPKPPIPMQPNIPKNDNVFQPSPLTGETENKPKVVEEKEENQFSGF